MKAPRFSIGARVTLKGGSELRGIVVAQDAGRVKVLWPNYASTWNSPAELVAAKGRRNHQRGE